MIISKKEIVEKVTANEQMFAKFCKRNEGIYDKLVIALLNKIYKKEMKKWFGLVL